jgi:hypothetical protein
MPKKKPPPELPKTADDPEQSRRFIETAKKLGADKSGEEFERLFKQVVPPKRGSKRRGDSVA